MAKTGSLSRKTYWPGPGDMLEDHTEGVCWECPRCNVLVDEVSGATIRYGVLLGRHPDYKEPIVKAIHENDERDWLDGVAVIKRKKAGGYVTYTWNAATKTWRQASA
jgi:hypothetical protein